MPRENYIKNSFNAGQISSRMVGRQDTRQYSNGLLEASNVVPYVHGGIDRRHDTILISKRARSISESKLVPFRFVNGESWVIEFSYQVIRFIKDDEVVQSGGVDYELSTPYELNEVLDLDFVQSGNELFVVHENHKPRVLTRINDVNWTFDEIDTKDGPYRPINQGLTSIELSSVVNQANIRSTSADFSSGDVGNFVEFIEDGFLIIGEIITFIDANNVTVDVKQNVVATETIDQRAVVSYASSSGSFPDRLRSTTTIWGTEAENSYIKVGSTWYLTGTHIAQFEEIPEVEGPPKAPAYSVDTIEVVSTPTMVSTSGNLSITSRTKSAIMTSSDSSFFDPSEEDGLDIRLDFLGTWVFGKIETTSGSPSATAKLNIDLRSTIPFDPKKPDRLLGNGKTIRWRLGTWSPSRGYPSVVSIHDQRLLFGSSNAESQTIWFSSSADYFNFSPSNDSGVVSDDNAITITIASETYDSIQWIESGPVLLVGTTSNEYMIKASTINQPLTPTDISARRQTSHGTFPGSKAIRIESAVLFINSTGLKINEMRYSFEQDSFVTRELTLMADDIFLNGSRAKEIVYYPGRDPIVWVLMEGNNLSSCVYDPNQEVIAWSVHSLGDAISIPSRYSLDSFCVISDDSSLYPELFISSDFGIIRMKREGESTRYYGDFAVTESVTKNGSSKTIEYFINNPGVIHVSILIDGVYYKNETILQGTTEVTIPDEALVGSNGSSFEIAICIPFISRIVIPPPAFQGPFGLTVGRTKRVIDVIIHADKCPEFNVKIGNGELTVYEKTEGPEQVQDFTGYLVFNPYDARFTLDDEITIEQKGHKPMALFSFMMHVSKND